MKGRFIIFVQSIVNPWVEGATGTPWHFSTGVLTAYGNANLEPEIIVNEEGDMIPVYLKDHEVDEVMADLGFKKIPTMDPYGKMRMTWMVELLPTTIL